MMLWPRFVLKDGPTKSDRKSFLERGSTMEEVVVVVVCIYIFLNSCVFFIIISMMMVLLLLPAVCLLSLYV